MQQCNKDAQLTFLYKNSSSLSRISYFISATLFWKKKKKLVWACYHYHLKKLLSWSHCLSSKASHLPVAHSEKKKGYLYSHPALISYRERARRRRFFINPSASYRWNIFNARASGTLSESRVSASIHGDAMGCVIRVKCPPSSRRCPLPRSACIFDFDVMHIYVQPAPRHVDTLTLRSFTRNLRLRHRLSGSPALMIRQYLFIIISLHPG